jgi:hypothetical protein
VAFVEGKKVVPLYLSFSKFNAIMPLNIYSKEK